ncbi:hypothetical protein B0H14DRAFT_2625153 [Mycena olivaceomarginata]|nr:hypothetical protein B0H14DRAFT_2625153 [Mycena olivaceomarginata]
MPGYHGFYDGESVKRAWSQVAWSKVTTNQQERKADRVLKASKCFWYQYLALVRVVAMSTWATTDDNERARIRKALGRSGAPKKPSLEHHREPRLAPLKKATLYVDGRIPAHQSTSREYYRCSLCSNMKAHPVSKQVLVWPQSLLCVYSDLAGNRMVVPRLQRDHDASAPPAILGGRCDCGYVSAVGVFHAGRIFLGWVDVPPGASNSGLWLFSSY